MRLPSKKISVRSFLIFLFLSGLVISIQAQDATEKVVDLYKYAEQIYSTDDLLVNGQIYIPDRPKAMGNPYFGENRFTEGTVKIKGRQFNDVLLKYNLETQRLILLAAVEGGKYVAILLNSNLVDAFSIDGQEFINARHHFKEADFSGFISLVYEGSFTFSIEYEKFFDDKYSQQKPYGSYSGMFSNYFIFHNGHIENVTKKKALLHYFFPVKKKLKSFMHKNKIRYKKASLTQLNLLMRYCDFISAYK